MEEVRSYWQVTSISHFCTTFSKPFKLPTFEPEELEQAFILDIPDPTTNNTITTTNNNNIINSNSLTNNCNNNSNNSNNIDNLNALEQNHDIDHNHVDQQSNGEAGNNEEENDDDDFEYKPTRRELDRIENTFRPPVTPQEQPDDQQKLHLLVRLAISLLKPHFNTKITPLNWENYLQRIVDTNWVELEHHPSPFRVPLISQDGVELTKKLTFNELPLSDKIDLFYALCDYRLWCEDAAEATKDYPLEELRLESIGKDSQGYEYWYFSGTRLFRENRELSQDIILRKTRIKELEYKLIELEKNRIFREQEEKRKAELERAKQLAIEAREARNAAKKQSEKETSKKRKPATPILPPRTGLRERRSSATSNTNNSQTSTPTTRSRQCKDQTPQRSNIQDATRSSSKISKHNQRRDKSDSPDLPKKSPDVECKEELERLAITKEDRAEAWSLQCDSLEDWESFALKFEKTKSINEKYLMAYINDELLPRIRAHYNKIAAEVRRKEKELLVSLTSRRVSTRIISKRAQEEEEERKAQMFEAEVKRKKVEAEIKLRAELEREMKARKNRLALEGGTSSNCSEDGDMDCNGGRYKTRHHQQQKQQYQQQSNDDITGLIHPDKLSEFYEALELVIDSVRTSKHAWPFVDPVPENVPGYYDLITEPMDLRKLRTKIEFREYKCLIEVEKDFQLIVNNCEKFNGPRNCYTKMVYKLWKSFRKNVRLFFQVDLSMDEYETFVYPPPPRTLTEEPHQTTENHSESIKEESMNNDEVVHDCKDNNSEAQAPIAELLVQPPKAQEARLHSYEPTTQVDQIKPEPLEQPAQIIHTVESNQQLLHNNEPMEGVCQIELPTAEVSIESVELKAPTPEPLDMPSPLNPNECPNPDSRNSSCNKQDPHSHADDPHEPKAPTPEPIFADSPLYEIII